MVQRVGLRDAKEIYRDIYTNPLTPLTFLKRSELVFPNRKAVVYRDKAYTWKEFAGRVYRLANGLKANGLQKNDRVALISRNNNACLEAFYGIGMAQGVCVPLNYRLAAGEMAYILNHSESTAVIYEHLYADAMREVKDELHTTRLFIEIDSPDKPDGEPFGIPYEEFLAAYPDDPLDVPVTDETDMLSIVYTSGTTGLPKGCVHTHRGAYLNALGEVIEARLTPDSAYLWTLPMFHCQGWCFVWAVTAVGAKHVCLDAVRADQIYTLMAAEKVTNMCGSPTVYVMITDHMRQNNFKFPHIVRGFMGGAAPTLSNIQGAEAVGIDIHQVYGLTEVYGPHSICEWNTEEWDRLPIEQRVALKARQGVPYATGTMMKVVDEDMREVPHDGKTAGEVVMRGNNLMQWYFKDFDKTNEAFAGGWFHSGDCAVVHPDGHIQIVDRIKDLIISGGENIASYEVENVIAGHPAVADVAVIGKPDDKWGEVVKAVIKLHPGTTVTSEEMIKWCKERLAGFKVPRDVEFGEVPRSSTGKVMKNALKKALKGG